MSDYQNLKNMDYVVSNYMDNGNFALLMTDTWASSYDICVTVNIVPLPPYYATIDTNNHPEVEHFLISQNIAKPVGCSIPSGFCEYPVFVFSPEKLTKLCSECIPEYERIALKSDGVLCADFRDIAQKEFDRISEL